MYEFVKYDMAHEAWSQKKKKKQIHNLVMALQKNEHVWDSRFPDTIFIASKVGGKKIQTFSSLTKNQFNLQYVNCKDIQ